MEKDFKNLNDERDPTIVSSKIRIAQEQGNKKEIKRLQKILKKLK